MKWLLGWYRNFVLPTAILIDLVIGAGIFTLPYVFKQSGFLIGVIYFIFFGLLSVLIHLMYAEIVVKTKDRHRLVGYAKLYLPKVMHRITIIVSLVGDILVLGAFIILGISFFNLIGDFPLWFKVFFTWAVGSIFIFASENIMAKSELFLNDSIFLTVLTIFLFFSSDFTMGSRGLLSINPQNWLLPLGPVAFSFLGFQAIPLIIDYFRNKRKKNNEDDYRYEKKSIIAGTLIPVVLYILFVVAIYFASSEVSPDAVSGLVSRVAAPALFIVGIFGIANLRSSYTIIGRDMRDSLVYDLGWSRKIAGLLVLPAPLLVFLIFDGHLLELVSFIGNTIVITYIVLVIWIWRVLKKRNSQAIFIG